MLRYFLKRYAYKIASLSLLLPSLQAIKAKQIHWPRVLQILLLLDYLNPSIVCTILLGSRCIGYDTYDTDVLGLSEGEWCVFTKSE